MEAAGSRFTAPEGGTRLAITAAHKNLLVTEYASFITTRLIYEEAYKIRGSLSDGKQRSIYVTRPSRIKCTAYELGILTDLKISEAVTHQDVGDWDEEMEVKEVLVCTSEVFKQILQDGVISMSNINVLVIDSAHLIFQDKNLHYIMAKYKENPDTSRPTILAHTYPLFNNNIKPQKTEENLKSDERKLNHEGDREILMRDDVVGDETKINDDGERNLEKDVTLCDESSENNCQATNTINDSALTNNTSDNDISSNNQISINNQINQSNDQLTPNVKNPTDNKITPINEIVLTNNESPKTNEEITNQTTDQNQSNKVNDQSQSNKELSDQSQSNYELRDQSQSNKELSDQSQSNNEIRDQSQSNKELSDQSPSNKELSDQSQSSNELSDQSQSNKELSDQSQSNNEISDQSQSNNEISDQSQSNNEVSDQSQSNNEISDQSQSNNEISDQSESNNEFSDQSQLKHDNNSNYYENCDDFDMYEKLEFKIEQLEQELCCEMDLAEDVDWAKRLAITVAKPKEIIIEYDKTVNQGNLLEDYRNVEKFMRETITDAEAFMNEHRYDPTEIYGDDLYEEFKNIPDPKIDPKNVFKQFIYVLDELGPYGADKAAFTLLAKLEKLKIKVPYERHFLLLCLCTTVFVKIRCYADLIFSKYENDWEKIQLFCTHKVHRFADILEQFQPTDTKKGKDIDNKETKDAAVKNDNRDTNKTNVENTSKMNSMLDVIEKCDFKTISDKIEDKINEYESNLKEIEVEIKIDSKIEVIDKESNDKETGEVINKEEREKKDGVKSKDTQKGYRRTGHRTGGRSNGRTHNNQLPTDSLCAVVFVNQPFMAKILFSLLVDMSRSNPKLSYICAQYCCSDATQQWGTEAKQREDVLKKFRMHDCNLLLATSSLEEGIDLPRCSLVLRWDMPPCYRSYALSRGRARAVRSAAILCTERDVTPRMVQHLAVYTELDQIITRKCGCGIQYEPTQIEEDQADVYCPIIKSYTPSDAIAPVNLTAVNVTDVNVTAVETKAYDSVEKDNGNSSDAGIKSVTANVGAEEANVKVTGDISDENVKVTDRTSVGEVKCKDSLNSQLSADIVKSVKISEKCEDEVASVDLNTAIALINRYCGKLPSDTFTRLAPYWKTEKLELPAKYGSLRDAYVCTLRLPLNAPVKYNIVGHPMPTKILARRMVALQACRILHKSGELDNQLMPIGKENFRAPQETSTIEELTGYDEEPEMEAGDAPRPGTTKRRQYYYKRTASAFTDCEPLIDACDCEIYPDHEHGEDECIRGRTPSEQDDVKGKKRNMLYAIISTLWCALPERYNTRGRRLHAPQNAAHSQAVLMSRGQADSLQIPAFPVYTRSGEVRVSIEYIPEADVRISPRRARQIRRFMRFVFAEVLRVRRCGMKLETNGLTHNNYYIVPTVKSTKDGITSINIDWAFLDLIYRYTEDKKHADLEKPILWHLDDEELRDIEREKKLKITLNQENTSENDVKNENIQENTSKDLIKVDKKEKNIENPLLKHGEVFVFDAEKYKEAVVTPWYRNQDQPQFFLVAEICWHLRPDSGFSSAAHATFREYYAAKYGAKLTQKDQPLLDVDHTSARLNLLTPRYVNRKGVALPVSSERTRRAKRDRLDQKQILVPELCRVHPFAAPLWFATVALPCVLYRINALLIADEIRRAVALDVGLGIPKINEKTCPGFQWPPLDFGWSLAEVLSAEEKNDKKKIEDDKEGSELNEPKELEDTEDTKTIDEKQETTEKTINDILAEKEETESGFEIGTWSNDMASSIPQMEYDEFMEPLPSNLTFCTSASGGTNWCDPIEKPRSQFNPTRRYSVADSDCSLMSSDFDTDSDLNSDASDDETDTSGFCSKSSNAAMGVRIEYKTAHEAEAVEIEKKKTNIAPTPDEEDDERDRNICASFIRSGNAPKQYVEKFQNAISNNEKEIIQKSLIKYNEPILDILPEVPNSISKDKPYSHIDKVQNDIDKCVNKNTIENKNDVEVKINIKSVDDQNSLMNDTAVSNIKENDTMNDENTIENNKFDTNSDIVQNSLKNDAIKSSLNDTDNSMMNNRLFEELFPYKTDLLQIIDGKISIESIEKNKRLILNEFKSKLKKEEIKNIHCFSMVDVDIDSANFVNEKISNIGFDTKEEYVKRFSDWDGTQEFKPYYMEGKVPNGEFDFDYQPDLQGHPGPSPSVILQALTMSNANDGINLERLETVGDSFLKLAITAHLYCAHTHGHEGKLSHMRSKQVSNLNLYRLGRNKRLGSRMIAMKFEPHDNWLPPCHTAPPALASELQDVNAKKEIPTDSSGCFIPYNLITQHSIPDKSIADCVEALIGAYLLECGPRGALLLMSWLGISVLPLHLVPLKKPPQVPTKSSSPGIELELTEEELATHRPVGSLRPRQNENGEWVLPIFGELKAPPTPLLRYVENPEGELERMLSGYDALERTLEYRFRDRSLLLQAMTHASHHTNCLTDCYQRLEFLGDAILDYLITRHLYEDRRRHSPGALTDLRSALVNNTIFATMAARHGFHKYFRHMSPGLNEVLTKYIKIQEENGHSISEEHYLIQEDEMEQAEDVEVPKALGDLFESVAGAIFLDSGMSLGAVWKSYVKLMGAELEAFSAAAPKSPVRELLEAEPDTAKFGKPERLADGRRVRVSVEVFGRGTFKGIGRNYRIAKGTAARCALRHLKTGRYH